MQNRAALLSSWIPPGQTPTGWDSRRPGAKKDSLALRCYGIFLSGVGLCDTRGDRDGYPGKLDMGLPGS